MARPFLWPRGLEPWTLLLLLATLVVAAPAGEQPTLVLDDTADLDTAALLATERPDEASVKSAPPSLVEAPTSVAAPRRVAEQPLGTPHVSAATVRRLAGEAAVPMAQDQMSVLEALLNSLDNARKVGVSSELEAQAETKVRAMARACLAKALAMEKSVENAWTLKQAFAHAERAGLPFSERDAAWVTLRADIRTKLSSALTAANATRTSETVHGLADALFMWRKLDFCHTHHMHQEDTQMVDTGREVFERQLQASFAKEDFDVTALAVSLANEAGAHYDRRVLWWVEVTRKLHNAASHLEQQTLSSLLDTVQPAIQFPLSRSQELQSVEEITKNLTLAELKAGSGQDIDHMLTNIENARRAGVNCSHVQQAELSARVEAAAALKKAIAGPKGLDSVVAIKDAFNRAERAGVPQAERDADYQALESEMLKRVTDATAAANRTRTMENLKELADAAFLWRKFAFPDVAPHTLAHAQEVYERQVQAAFEDNDLNYTVLGVRLSSQAGAQHNAGAFRWAEVYDRLVVIAKTLEDQSVSVLLEVIQHCKEASLPQTSYLALVETEAKQMTLAQLNQVLSSNDTSLENMLGALQNAKDSDTGTRQRSSKVGGSDVRRLAESSEVSAANTKVQSLGLAQLRQALTTSTSPENLPLIREAFALAARAGVQESDQASAWTELQGSSGRKVTEATRAAKDSRTTQTIQALADAIFCWRKLQFSTDPFNVLAPAQEVYGEQIEAGLKAQDIDFTVLAVRLAGQAGVQCSETARTWANVAERVHQAVADIDAQSLSALVSLVDEAKGINHPATAGLKLLETTVQEAVAAQLNETLPRSEL